MRPGSLADVALRFATDDDMLAFESKLDLGGGNGIAPRTDRTGKKVRDYDRYHQQGMNEIARRLRGRRDLPEPIELGRLGIRSKAYLRDPAACFALHFLFMDMQQSSDTFLRDKADYYWRLAGNMLDSESSSLDYDTDNTGTIEDIEKAQPFPSRFIRG